MQGKSVSRLPFNLTWKAILAFAFPVVAAVASAAATWITGGSFDVGPIRLAAGGLVLGGIAAIGAYVGKPGQVLHPELESADIHDAEGA